MKTDVKMDRCSIAHCFVFKLSVNVFAVLVFRASSETRGGLIAVLVSINRLPVN